MAGRQIGRLAGTGAILSSLLLGTQQAAGDPAAESISAEDPSFSEISNTSLARARRVTRLPEWPGIRSIWKELNQVEPDSTGYYSFGILDYDRAGKMREKLTSLGDRMISRLVEENIPTLEVDLVLSITRMRINLMSYGFPSMLTRMMPPPVEYHKGALLEEIEARVDTLLDLSESGVFSMDQVSEITRSILETAVTISVLETITSNYRYNSGYPGIINEEVDPADMIDLALADMQRHYDDVTDPDSEISEFYDPEELTDRYESTLEAVEEVRNCTAGLNYLILDLLLDSN